jgi:hypothetical protein
MGFINLETRGNFLVITMDFTDPTTNIVRHCLLSREGWKEVPEGTDWRHLPGILLWRKKNEDQAKRDFAILEQYFNEEKLRMAQGNESE